jgi:hypothetical protein
LRPQHEPHKVEFQVFPGTPPMFGNEGREEKVVYPLVKRPFKPLEQETESMDPSGLPYVASHVTYEVIPNAGRAKTDKIATTKVSFIV